jgi:plasmid replication initiation protein
MKLISKALSKLPSGNGRYITMSNALTRAGHGLSLAEKRLIMCSISHIDSKQKRDGIERLEVKITAAEYAETFGVDLDTAYTQLQSGAKNLYERSINFFEPAFARDGKPIEPTVVKMRWIGYVKYQKKEGWVELAFIDKVIPHLIGLQKQYTTYQLQQASALRSQYSWKLLELLMRFQSTGWAYYTIEDFCVSMDISEKMKSDFNNIRRRVIEPAVKELVEKDGWLIHWEIVKAGRKVKALKFAFSRNPQGTLFPLSDIEEPEATNAAFLDYD